jgi:hypothetical protein
MADAKGKGKSGDGSTKAEAKPQVFEAVVQDVGTVNIGANSYSMLTCKAPEWPSSGLIKMIGKYPKGTRIKVTLEKC